MLYDEILSYVKSEYGTEAEHTFRSNPEFVVLRHEDNRKWYGVIMYVKRSALGMKDDEYVDILNVKAEPMVIDMLAGQEGYCFGYHMNKQHWLTILLDGTVDLDHILDLLDASYEMTASKKKKVLKKIKHFSLEQICDSGQCFRMKKLETELDPEDIHGGNLYEVISRDRYLRLSQKGDLVSFYCSREEFKEYWSDYFDLKQDYEQYISSVNPNDRYLMEACRLSDGVRILKQDLWEMIVTFLISQQNNIKRIHHCIDEICENYGKPCLRADGTIYHAFPEPEVLAVLDEDELKKCNLGYRSKYVVRTAKAVVTREIDLSYIEGLSHNKAKEELLKCFGVGEKVADCICLFALHQLDAFPVDTHIRQAMEEHYKRGFPNRRYKGYRGVIQQYIFYYELHKKGDR